MTAVLRAEEPSARNLVEIEPALTRGFELLAMAPSGIAKLRELVLAMAFRGKLTRPEDSDSSVEHLLVEIAGRREQRVASGEMRADRPSPQPVDEEMPFDLPRHWRWVRLAQLGQIVGGGTPKSDDVSMWSPAGIPWLTPADLYRLREKTIGRGRRDISDKGLGESSARVLPAGTVLFSSRAPIGYVAIAANALATNQGFKSCVPYVPQLADYLYWYLKHAARGIDAAASGTTFKEVSGAEFSRVLVPFPPLAEQHRIVARVEELTKLCDALEQNGRLADEQHARLSSTLFDALAASQSSHALAENWQRVAGHLDLLLDRPEAIDALERIIVQLAVRGLLVAQDAREGSAVTLMRLIKSHKSCLVIEGKLKRDKPLAEVEATPFDIPSSWEWVRLGSIGEAFDYGTSQKSVDDPSGVPVLRMGNVQGGRVVMTGLKYLIDQQSDLPDLLLRPGDLLFNRTNSYELVGKTGLYEGFERDVTFASYLIRIRLPTALCIAQYVNMYMNTIDCRRHEIEPDLTQQTGQANYNGTKLRNIRVPLPPLAEQHRIVARVEELRRLCADLRQRLTQARETQSALADALVAEFA